MPYNRRYRKYNRTRTRRRYKRAPPKPARYQAADMAYKAYQGVQYLKGLVNAELHTFDTDVASVAIPSTGYIRHLSDVNQGDQYFNRQGNSILAKFLFGRLEFTKSSSATDTFIRLMIIKDNQQVGDTTPNISDILTNVNTKSSLNPNSKGRFKVLKDELLRFDVNSTGDYRKYNLSLPFHIKYNGTTGVDIQKNGVYIVMISNEAVNTPNCGYSLRLSYYDN